MDNGACSYRRFLEGDDNSFVDIIKEYKDGLMLYINGIVGNLNTAEEIVEETFYKLVIKKPRYNGKAAFKTWLYTIARNTAYDMLKKRAKHVEVSVEEFITLLKDEEDLEQSYIKEENRIALHKNMSKLKAEHRQVLWLVYFENFSAEECSKVMGKNPHAIEGLLYRAKNALRKLLESESFDI